MVKIYSYGNKWYHIPPAHSPDKDIINYEHQTGEFSLFALEAFKKNCAKLEYNMTKNPYYQKLNGKKLQAVVKYNRLFYGKAGLEEIIYGRKN